MLRSQAFTVDKDAIAANIKAHEKGKRLISQAILNATKFNVHRPYLAATEAFKAGGSPDMIRTSTIGLA